MSDVPVTVMFVCDTQFDRQSASPETARLMVRSVRRWHPDWGVVCGYVGDIDNSPAWLDDLQVDAAEIEPPDPVLRFMNKVETVRTWATYVANTGGYGLFLDGDVVMMRPMPEATVLSMGCVGVHSDYPNPSTRDWVGRQVYGACGVRFPGTRVRCSMYGGETWPTLNVGAFWLRHDVIEEVAELWLKFSHEVKDVLRGDTRTFSEQTALMPTLDKLGVGYQLLNAAYNWNGTIFPSKQCPEITGEPVVFNHYHRADVLESDPDLKALVEALRT
jgi:hypothetical protein